jgi:sugar phosphate isomerase/epimerase
VQGALKELIPLAETSNVTLAVEPMHPGCAEEWTFLTSLNDAMQLVESLASSRVKIVLDTYHLGLDAGLVERIRATASSIAIVQLGDAKRPPSGEQNRCRLGEGVVPLIEIIAALKAGGYDGFYDVELLGEELEAVDYTALLRHAQEAFQQFVG